MNSFPTCAHLVHHGSRRAALPGPRVPDGYWGRDPNRRSERRWLLVPSPSSVLARSAGRCFASFGSSR
jgi:hypothetical protein